jgi:hypothetical protein
LRKNFPRQFPSFKKWLSLDDDLELFALYRYPGQLVLSAAEGNANFTPGEKFDLRDYFPVSERRGGVMYCKKGRNVADFIDYGKRIAVTNKFDESIVLAALQLASQKWGTVQINGSKEYKRLCVRVAVKHNIRLANPELKAEVEAVRKSGVIGIKPKVGQRVTFHVHDARATLTGEVVSIDDDKETVTLRAGRTIVPVMTAKGYFSEAAPLEHTHTKEYAYERAKEHAGGNGSVFFARDEGVYKGPIVEATPTYAIQKTGLEMMTLHRLKDLEGFDEELIGNQEDVVIRKTAGVGTVCVEPQHIEKEKDKGRGR